MVLLLIGLVLFGVAVLLFWQFKPRDGKVNPWVTKPLFQSAIPITITSTAALGLAMIVAGMLH